MLLSTLRKALSILVLKRISEQVDAYLSPCQSGFRKGRSTADCVWAMRFLAARAQHKKWECFILGIDLSRAFDTVNRTQLLQVMGNIVDGDSLKLIRLLLANTSARVRVEKSFSDEFRLLIGTPQGDSISPVLFTCLLEACLREVRQNLPPRPASDADIIKESQYADDCNFYSTSKEWLQSILPILVQTFKKWGLSINESKTEWVHIHLHERNRGEEEWRKVRQLGSLLGDGEDVQKRISLASLAFRNCHRILTRKSIRLRKRITIYNSFVLPMLCYNCGTWGLTKAETQRLVTFHRRQLRQILGIRWPNIIKNNVLYRITGTTSLEDIIRNSRMRLLGHCLRLPIETPAQEAMEHYYQASNGRRGRPRTSLPVVLNEDLKTAGLMCKNIQDLATLRNLAQDKISWRRMCRTV